MVTQQVHTILPAHAAGDAHLLKAIQYEKALRCRWLLDLRGTPDRISVATGEDCRIVRPNGKSVYRQAKKREGYAWTPSEILGLIREPWRRFQQSAGNGFELFTNSAVPSELRGRCLSDNRFNLQPSHPHVVELAGGLAEEFSRAVVFHQHFLQPQAEWLMDWLKGEIQRTIDRSFCAGNPSDLIGRDVRTILGRLLEAESTLIPGQEKTWADIDRTLGIEELVMQIPVHLSGQGSLLPLEECIQESSRVNNDEHRACLEASAKGLNVTRRPLDAEISNAIRGWRVTPPQDYRIVILRGGSGAGKTWTLFRLALDLQKSGLRVWVGDDRGAIDPRILAHLGVMGTEPSVVIIDGLFPHWANSLLHPVGVPMLVVASVWRGLDDEELADFQRKRGTRFLGVIEVPDRPTQGEIAELARMRGVTLARREMRATRRTNLRHVSLILSGRRPEEHLAELRKVASSSDLLRFLEPIWYFSAEGVRIPRSLLERFVGQSIPDMLSPWVLRFGGDCVGFEDAAEARQLLKKYRGGAMASLRAQCGQLFGRIDQHSTTERGFIRTVLARYRRKDPALLQYVISSHAHHLREFLSGEPDWALVFCWLPALSMAEDHKLLREGVEDLASRSPATVATKLLWLEVYNVDSARSELEVLARRIARFGAEDVAEFIEVVSRQKEEALQADMGARVVSWFTDLAEATALEILQVRNMFQEVGILAAHWGSAPDRSITLDRLGKLLEKGVADREKIRENWLQVYLTLATRVRQQPRSRLALQISRALAKGTWGAFCLEDCYRECLENEQGISVSAVVRVAGDVLRQETAAETKLLPGWTNNVLDFVSSWGSDEEWGTFGRIAVGLMRTVSPVAVSPERASAFLLGFFSPMRRSSRGLSEEFMQAVLPWMPASGVMATEESGKLGLRILGFLGCQSWLSEAVRSKAREFMLGVARSWPPPPIEPILRLLPADVTLQSQGEDSSVGLSDDWTAREGVAEVYLSEIWRLQFTNEERSDAVRTIIDRWGTADWASQHLVSALLRLGEFAEAIDRATTWAGKQPAYPDPIAYLAIGEACVGHLDESRKHLDTLVEVYDKTRRGPHLPVLSWLYKELGRRTAGRIGAYYLVCAELYSSRRLREYISVVGTSDEGG